ncbi:TetR/AcrR family transcriptional regulator [Streptomyces sp. JV176]|uniref:TetR/AcrR family transcriptional regulator n=1 Tax=Streptomyces sp. JV176 TaxID=858630 RepID=UPI002E75ACBE|nr:TetR/AcrR family transcriptional regulator [Streptomyces sp. JV176]MEE1797420.1 TetR/AcrR family transcriptional regulator [Streptomyces sp. JV176]
MPKSPTKRRPRTVASLTDSALALFTEHGFHATSISDIVERAGLTRGAFYSNYRDKDELFLALYDAHADRLLADLRDEAARLDPGEDLVDGLLAYTADRAARERQWFLVSMEFTLHAARTPAVAELLAVHEERLVQGVSGMITETLARTGLRPAIDPADGARLLIALFKGISALEPVQGPRGLRGTDGLSRRIAPYLIRALTTAADPGAAPHPNDDEGTPER